MLDAKGCRVAWRMPWVTNCNLLEPAPRLAIGKAKEPEGAKPLFEAELIWPVVGAILMGGIIGFEREYRSSPAGFRTHILVSLSSALLMLAAVHQVRWLSDTPVDIIRIDPVRMAHGVLTGIGFLCGGVIFREGFTVRGLTTAASLWTTSALGVLFGVGFIGLAVIGGVATLLVLAAVGLTESLVPQRHYADIRIRFRRDAPIDASEFRRLLKDHDLSADGVTQTLDAEGVEFSTTASPYTETGAEALAATVRLTPSVVSFTCEPRRA